MKVLHIEGGKNFYGGSTQVFHLINGLCISGVDNVLICPYQNELTNKLQDRTKIYGVSFYGDLDLSIFFKILCITIIEKPDVIHVHSRRGVDFYGGLVGFLTRTKCILTRRVDDEENSFSKLKYPLYQKVVSISDAIRNVLLKHKICDDKLLTIKSAIELPDLKKKNLNKKLFIEKKYSKENTISIAVVAQLIPRKGHLFLIDAIHDILKKNNKIQVYFYGKGHYEKVIRKKIAEFNLTNQIHMKGFVKDVHELLPSFDIVVHPALKEGLGISLLQASAAGIPIVATRVGGIPECVIDQRNGLVVKQGCSESLKKAIIRLIENPDLRDILGKNGVEVIKEKFSIPLMVDKYYELYKNLF